MDDAHEGDERNLRPAANVEEDGYDTDLEIEGYPIAIEYTSYIHGTRRQIDK